MAHNEPPHLDLRCLQIQLLSFLVLYVFTVFSTHNPEAVGFESSQVMSLSLPEHISLLVKCCDLSLFIVGPSTICSNDIVLPMVLKLHKSDPYVDLCQ